MRRCRKCGEAKPLERFVKERKCEGGRTHTCLDCRAAYLREWKAANPERVRDYNARHRHALLFGGEDNDYLFALRGDPCSYCGKPVAGSIDHIEPAAAGGTDTWDNFTAVCGTCNSSKGTRPLLLFLAQRNGCYEYRQDVAA